MDFKIPYSIQNCAEVTTLKKSKRAKTPIQKEVHTSTGMKSRALLFFHPFPCDEKKATVAEKWIKDDAI